MSEQLHIIQHRRVHKGRPLFRAHEKPFSYIFVHSHSHNSGPLDPAKRVPADQAHDANAFLLGNARDVVVTSLPVEEAYMNYWSDTLNLSPAVVYAVPAEQFHDSTLQSLLDHIDLFIEFLKEQKAKGVLKETIVLSVFEADQRDKQLLECLQKAGLGHVVPECNYDLLDLGTKTTWRKFCESNGISQVDGGVFHDVETLRQFIQLQLSHGHSVLLKSPHGIGGLDQLRIRPDPQNTIFQFSKEQLAFVRLILDHEHEVLAETFADNVESEQVVDIYIDPVLSSHHNAEVFDQLTKRPSTSEGGIAYYGYPSVHFEAKQQITEVVKKSLLPALLRVTYKGPAGVDVLYRPPHPPHFIELNMRTDAITYIKHLADRIGKKNYGKEPGQTAFMTLVNLQHCFTFPQILDTFGGTLECMDEGVFVLTNPNRHRWGFYDVAAISPLGLHVAEGIMRKGLTAIWGEETAHTILNDIQRNTSTLLTRRGHNTYPYLVSLPPDYEDPWTPDTKWPLIMFLHGMDERGSDLSGVKNHGIPKTVLQHKDFPFISVSPQCSKDESHWDIQKLRAILDEVEKEFRVDPDRIYLTGCSMGGEGVWRLAISNPDRFAAIAPICGDAPQEKAEHVERIKHLPIWVFHGVQDMVVPFDDSQRMVEALRQVRAKDVKFTEYHDVAHDAWTDTYDNPELYQWFLSHTKTKVAL